MVNERSPSADATAAAAVVGAVVDPELPMLTLDDLGIVRRVAVAGDGRRVEVTLTPTYSGCPALDAMRTDVHRALTGAGYGPVTVRTTLTPPWDPSWISAEGRAKLAAAGIAPPGPGCDATCPRCDAGGTEELSRFGPTPCTALRRCRSCREPFELVKLL